MLGNNKVQIIFILGPSGVGKSTIGPLVSEALDFLYIEVDRYPDGDGIDLENIRTQWNVFCNKCNASPLAKSLRKKALMAGRKGVVLTFPSLFFEPDSFKRLEKENINVFILSGSSTECLGSFLRRERKTGRNLTIEHWLMHNNLIFSKMFLPEYEQFRISAFKSGRHRGKKAIANEFRNRFYENMQKKVYFTDWLSGCIKEYSNKIRYKGKLIFLTEGRKNY